MSEDTSCGAGSERAAEVRGSEHGPPWVRRTEHSAERVCTSTLAAAWISQGHTGLPTHMTLRGQQTSEREGGRE